VDTGFGLLCSGLKCIRAKTAQMLVSPTRIVESIDIVWHVFGRELAIFVDVFFFAYKKPPVDDRRLAGFGQQPGSSKPL
jgi:hypothetical protein